MACDDVCGCHGERSVQSTITTDVGSPQRHAILTLLWKHDPPLGLSWVATCELADKIIAVTHTT